MVTIPWCSENDEKHRRPCGTPTLWLYRAFKAGFRYKREKKIQVFLRELFKEKKINQPVPFCFSSHGNLELQTRAYPLLCILQLLYSFYWCSLNLSLRLTTWICTNRRWSYVSHGPRWVFCHAKEKKKSSASVKLFRGFFFSFFFFFPDQWHYYCTTVCERPLGGGGRTRALRPASVSFKL